MEKRKKVRTRVAFATTIRKSYLVKIRALSRNTGLPISKIVDGALEDYFKKFEKEDFEIQEEDDDDEE